MYITLIQSFKFIRYKVTKKYYLFLPFDAAVAVKSGQNCCKMYEQIKLMKYYCCAKFDTDTNE